MSRCPTGNFCQIFWHYDIMHDMLLVVKMVYPSQRDLVQDNIRSSDSYTCYSCKNYSQKNYTFIDNCIMFILHVLLVRIHVTGGVIDFKHSDYLAEHVVKISRN